MHIAYLWSFALVEFVSQMEFPMNSLVLSTAGILKGIEGMRLYEIDMTKKRSLHKFLSLFRQFEFYHLAY